MAGDITRERFSGLRPLSRIFSFYLATDYVAPSTVLDEIIKGLREDRGAWLGECWKWGLSVQTDSQRFFFLMKWRLPLRHLMYMLVQCIVLAPVFPVVNSTEINLALQVPSFKQVEASCKVFLTAGKSTRFWRAFPHYWPVKTSCCPKELRQFLQVGGTVIWGEHNPDSSGLWPAPQWVWGRDPL